MSVRRRGFDAERELARILWGHGFAVVRGPASGARTRRLFYPDLTAIYKGRVYVFEVKYRRSMNSGAIYVSRDKLERLKEFARRAGGEAFIAVKLPGKGWYLVSSENVKQASTTVKIDVETLSKAIKLEEFIRSVLNAPLTSF